MRKIQSKSLSLWHLPPFGEATRSSGFWRQRRSRWNGRFPSSLRRVQKLKRHRKSGNAGKLLHPMITIRTIQNVTLRAWYSTGILIFHIFNHIDLRILEDPVFRAQFFTPRSARQERRLSYEGENRFWRRLGGFLGWIIGWNQASSMGLLRVCAQLFAWTVSLCEIQQPFSHSSGKVNTQAALVCGSYGKTLSRGALAEGNSSDMRVGSFRPKAPRSLPVYPFWNQHNIALEQ